MADQKRKSTLRLEPMSSNLFFVLAYKYQVWTRLHPSYTIAVMPFWIHLKLGGTNKQNIFFFQNLITRSFQTEDDKITD